MELDQLLARTALALGIGLLIGLERAWQRRSAESGSRAAGIRTFAISGLLGGITGAIAQAADGGAIGVGGGIVLGAGFAAFAAVIALFSREENRAAGSYSATTAIAAMLTFVLGVYALIGDVRIAAAAAVAAAGILATREAIHGLVEKITWPELRSGLVLLAMTCIALPILKDDPVGSFGGVNPREVWIIAIVLASVSFLGYLAVKILGVSRGVLLAAAAGGIVSSTAVTLTNARRAAAGAGAASLLAAGVAVATAVSFLRVFAIAAVIQPRLILLVAPALVAATVAAVAVGLALAFRAPPGKPREHQETFRNPFEFWSVVGFAVFLGLVMMLGRAVGETFGALGATVGAIAIGLADVDSVTVSVAHLAPGVLTLEHGAYAILAGAASNTVSKAAIGATIGRGRFAAEIAVMAVICLAAGAGGLALTRALFAGA